MGSFSNLLKHYGLKGLEIYFQLKTNRTNKIFLPKIEAPISLRPGTTDIPTFKQVFVYREYEYPINFVPKVIIDAGANIGLSAVYFANKFRNAHIYSIEPETNNFKLLKQNVSPYTTVTPIQAALWNSSSDLGVIDKGLGEWGFMVEERNKGETSNKINSIKSVTIKDLLQSFKIKEIDILKIDIEGAEKELFESNFEDWLPRVKCLMIELHDRMKAGCSKSFFKAISRFNFSYDQKGENL
ncbi:FkbM family methyltransferase, partial [Xanthovirga aplysinae]|uniref:FkbM family methyltransferase n=1 Tax=Xanthovirga aplysinae TaxID=2529853 RepID=UPI0012BB8645